MSRVVRKPAFCICENKDADQLRGNREADQRLCFRYTDSTIPLLPTSEISSLCPSSVTAQSGLCRTWSETPKTGFLRTRLIWANERHVKKVDNYARMFYLWYSNAHLAASWHPHDPVGLENTTGMMCEEGRKVYARKHSGFNDIHKLLSWKICQISI